MRQSAGLRTHGSFVSLLPNHHKVEALQLQRRALLAALRFLDRPGRRACPCTVQLTALFALAQGPSGCAASILERDIALHASAQVAVRQGLQDCRIWAIIHGSPALLVDRSRNPSLTPPSLLRPRPSLLPHNER